MNYLDVYFSRVNHFGETTAERIKNSGIVAFEKWMAQSPFTVVDLSVERGYYFSGIIETSKDKEEKTVLWCDEAYLLIDPQVPQTLVFLRNVAKRCRKYERKFTE